jgi:hypothetical protein
MKWILSPLVFFICLSHAQAQQIAEALLVNLDATVLPANGMLNEITNTGTMGGVFEATGGGNTVPTAVTLGGNGTRAIRFNGLEYMQHVDAPGGARKLAHSGIVGSNRTCSIEAWVYNRDVPAEETIVSWGHRGGPEGSNMSFNFGSHAVYGAVGHWGGPDIGWGVIGSPSIRTWHLLTYTFDGTTTRVYIDGALANSEVLPTNAINTHTNTPITLAAQMEADTSVTGILRGSLDLARLRIHDGVLSDAQVLANYDSEKAGITDGTSAAFTRPIHRYSFENPNGLVTGPTTVVDHEGGADATVRGAGASFLNGQLSLPGGSSASAAYVDLPNGLLSTLSGANAGSGQVTFEGWYTLQGISAWERLFDFGRSDVGEISGPGTVHIAYDNVYLARLGTSIIQKRVEVKNTNPLAVTEAVEFNSYSPDNAVYHFAFTWDEASGEIRVFEYGQEIATLVTTLSMADITDVNNWLGRSQNSVDNNLSADLDEFRIYDYVLTPEQVLGSFQAGSDVLFDDPGALLAIMLQAARTNLFLDETKQLVVFGDFEHLSSINITASNITYLSSDTNVLQVSTNGLVTALREGTSTITATLNAFSDDLTFTVSRIEPLNLVHRYPFTTNADDVIGGAHGVLTNNTGTASYTNGMLVLGNAATANSNSLDGDFVELPDGTISALGSNVTFETWTTWNGPAGSNWQRIFDFGISDGGNGISSIGANSPYVFLTPRGGPGVNLFGHRNPAAQENQAQDTVQSSTGAENHYVVVWNGVAGTSAVYINKQLVGTTVLNMQLSELNDLNNWLGRSQWPDPYYNGSYNEFRIYQGAMTAFDVADSFDAGPDSVSTDITVLSIARVPGNMIRIAWPRDPGGFTLQSVDRVAGVFTNSLLLVVEEGAENAAYTTAMDATFKVFRLAR